MAFHPTSLVGQRNRLRGSDRPRRLFEDTKALAKETGAMKGRARVLHSTPLYDAVATQDTVIQLARRHPQVVDGPRSGRQSKYLAAKGEGLHHVGYRVDDCAVALEAVKQSGGRVIDESPRPGSRGTTVAFVHPKTSFGTLIELVQE